MPEGGEMPVDLLMRVCQLFPRKISLIGTECPISFEEVQPSQLVVTECKHHLSVQAYNRIKRLENPRCPMCRAPLAYSQQQTSVFVNSIITKSLENPEIKAKALSIPHKIHKFKRFLTLCYFFGCWTNQHSLIHYEKQKRMNKQETEAHIELRKQIRDNQQVPPSQLLYGRWDLERKYFYEREMALIEERNRWNYEIEPSKWENWKKIEETPEEIQSSACKSFSGCKFYELYHQQRSCTFEANLQEWTSDYGGYRRCY